MAFHHVVWRRLVAIVVVSLEPAGLLGDIEGVKIPPYYFVSSHEVLSGYPVAVSCVSDFAGYHVGGIVGRSMPVPFALR